MMAISRIKRILEKSPRYIFKRICHELKLFFDRRVLEPFWQNTHSGSRLLSSIGINSVEEFLNTIDAFKFPGLPDSVDLQRLSSNSKEKVMTRAEFAMSHSVDLMGSGPVQLGREIQWNRDYISGVSWPNERHYRIEYTNLDQSSDVKFPWELSRLQWLIPVCQAFLLTDDIKYARFCERIITSWIEKNPVGESVNWSCTMEPAIRIYSLIYFFLVLKGVYRKHNESKFLEVLLCSIYQHARFVYRNLEISDVNGNHYTANISGLYVASLFLHHYGQSQVWQAFAVHELEKEIRLQIHSDGVDFEGSIPYHRLVAELFGFPHHLSRLNRVDSFSGAYQLRLNNMMLYTSMYLRPDGLAPIFGDNDDARVLPLGTQGLNDHRYLVNWLSWILNSEQKFETDDDSELAWLGVGGNHDGFSDSWEVFQATRQSRTFESSGMTVLCSDSVHLVIDGCSLGQSGRGGHDHNDLLSFELSIGGIPLVTDSGSFAYTGNYKKRNAYRATSAHNTPQVDGEEINRFTAERELWTLQHDARPLSTSLVKVARGRESITLNHDGYSRLYQNVRIERKFSVDHLKSSVCIHDIASGTAGFQLSIPFHLHPSIKVDSLGPSQLLLTDDLSQKQFMFTVSDSSELELELYESFFAKSYGIERERQAIRLRGSGPYIEVKATITAYENS